YGAGNLSSVKKAFEYLGAAVAVTNEPSIIQTADKVVLPGVGHFSSLRFLEQTGLRELLLESIRIDKPFLGICLGMQWLFEGSVEAPDVPGASVFPGICQRFSASVKSPHVGWNSLAIREQASLLRHVPSNAFVYYTHSFHAPLCVDTAAQTEYGS